MWFGSKYNKLQIDEKQCDWVQEINIWKKEGEAICMGLTDYSKLQIDKERKETNTIGCKLHFHFGFSPKESSLRHERPWQAVAMAVS